MSKIEEMRKSLKEILEKLNKSNLEKDELDEKIKAKMRAEMDKRNFGDAEAQSHTRDIDESIPAKQRTNLKNNLKQVTAPKPKLSMVKEEGPLWQQHHEKNKPEHLHDHIMMVGPVLAKDEGEQKYHIHVDGYRITKEPMSLAMIHKTQGKNLEKDPSIKIVPHNPGTAPVVKGEDEVCKMDNNGQWKIEKSNYGPKGMGLYDSNKNAERKANNTGDVVPDAGKNVNVKSYTTTNSSVGSAVSDAEAKRQAAANKVAPVRTLVDMSEEEKASIGKKLKKTDGEKIKDCTSCGHPLTTKNAKFIGEQKLPEGYGNKQMNLYNCPKCDSTVAHLEDK
jgi:hypothetical protein